MTVSVGLTSDVVQSVALTRQTIQSIEILEYSTEELGSLLQEKAMRNPLIKLELPAVKQPMPVAFTGMGGGTGGGVGTGGREPASFTDYLSEPPPPFRTDLLRQLSLMRLDPRADFLARHLIEALDDDGYLRDDLHIQADILGAELDELEHALGLVQQLEPTGVGARDLRECLLLQLAEQGEIPQDLRLLLDHFDLLAQGKTERLARLCKIPLDQLPQLLGKLRKLSPRPNLPSGGDPVQPALPDILVKVHENGDLGVELNPDLLPRVLIDNEYCVQITGAMRAREDRSYLRNCLQEANLLLRNLAQRAETSLMIASWIVKLQADFFTNGARALKPLSQKEVAQLAGVHESTVSRSISSRYLLCEQGLFPLKYFFSDGLAATSEGAPSTAATAIRERIRDMVRNERAETVLSDDDIVTILAAEGIVVARRTVAKYRMQLNIDSSAARRRRLQLERQMA